MIPTVLCIGGLDPSGGAGLTADQKTATALGVYSMAVLTAVTVQHPGKVERVAPLPAAIVGEQLSCLLETMPIGAIKIGMIGNAAIAETLIHILGTSDLPVVLDPVRIASSGATLSTLGDAVFAQLLSLADIITPNSHELTQCVGDSVAGKWAIDQSVAVLHTGGHSETDPIHDTLWLPSGIHRRWSHPRVDTSHTHGSGCVLSTAVAAGLAKKLDLTEACAQAIQYTSKLIDASASQDLVSSNGPLLHFRLSE